MSSTSKTTDLAGVSGISADYLGRHPENTNYLLQSGYELVFTRIPHVTYFCQSVSLPGVNISDVPRQTPFAAKLRLPGTTITYDDLTVNFVVDEAINNWKEVFAWMNSLVNTEDFVGYEEDDRKHYSDATISIKNSAMNAKFRIHFKDLFPLSLSSLDFDSRISDSEPITCSASFAYRTYEIETL